MNILIIGCGRVGSSLALLLTEKGHDVAVLEQSQELLDGLAPSFPGLTFCGIPIDNDMLRAAGIAQCDVVCAVTDNENTNIMVSQVAKNFFGVKVVLTRVFDQAKGDIFTEFGLSVVCSTALTVDAIASALDEYDGEQYLYYGQHKVKFYQLPIPREYVGERTHDIMLDQGEVLYAIIRADGAFHLVNNNNIIMQEGDRLVFSRVVA